MATLKEAVNKDGNVVWHPVNQPLPKGYEWVAPEKQVAKKPAKKEPKPEDK